MTAFRVEPAAPRDLAAYATVPIAFRAASIYQVIALDEGGGGFRLEEVAVAPFEKDFDVAQPPTDWPARFDVSRWRFFLARADGAVVGGAAVARDTRDLLMLEGRTDLACLWDLRVRPAWRGRGVGAALFREAAGWAAAAGCRWLKVESQNNNVGACTFYRRQGCHLGQVHLHAYDGTPTAAGEVMLVWYLDLAPAGAPRAVADDGMGRRDGPESP
ncbi:MAG: GNAT family N-acetyltransferase [Planctomycetes bacterium]|nr:GNAT family N-acetyltransferase [Planctomycetota bacterium]